MSFATLDDKALMQMIGAQDERAMKELYQRHANAVLRYALKFLKNEVDAVEVMNEVMLQVWQKPDAFAGRSKLSTWLFSVTHNKAIDAIRKNTKHEHDEIHDEHIEGDQACDDCALSQAMVASENHAELQRCLEGLSFDHKQVVHLAFYQEQSYTEISEILEVPKGTVKTRVMHAKNALAKCLQAIKNFLS